MVINRAKFDACTYSSFRGVKTDRQRDRIALCILDKRLWYNNQNQMKLCGIVVVLTVFFLFKLNQETGMFIYGGTAYKLTNRWYFTILRWNQLPKDPHDIVYLFRFCFSL